MSTGAAVAGRQRAREARLAAASRRRLQLDPEKAARNKRIDEATLDVEDAWTQRAQAEAAVLDAERAVARGVTGLLAEKLTLVEIAGLTGLEIAVVRRLRQLHADHGSGRARRSPTP